MKKCACGRDITRHGSDICGVCYSRQKKGGTSTFQSGGSTISGLPRDYLNGGYFDADGNLKPEYLVKDGFADKIASDLKDARPEITNHQLRRFYGHVRAADNRLRMTGNFPAVYNDLKKLDSFVAEAKGKKKIQDLFYEFMVRNLKETRTEKDFKEGFMEHFQALVGFFTYYHPK
jgi:CRISPR-associated protein Csm2